MPLYFAYGSNMHEEGFHARCPRSRLIGPAELPVHAFYLMAGSGYAAVRPDPAATVHGALIDLDPSDLPALDDYEDLAGGLYTRAGCEVLFAGATRSALLYLGGERRGGGSPPPGYMECVLAAGQALGLPADYLAGLAALLPAAAQPGRAPLAW